MAAAKKRGGVTWAQATRDIVLRLIATGQLPIGIFGGVILLLVYKTPADRVADVWRTLNLLIRAHAGLGYSLSVIISVGWFLHARFQRRNAEAELRRLSKERTQRQQESFKSTLESSED
jgi:hypothetical protein